MNNTNRHIARAKCKLCKDELVTNHGGHFVSCSCGKSFLDQERWDAGYCRFSSDTEFLGQECPKNCKLKAHKLDSENKKEAISELLEKPNTQ